MKRMSDVFELPLAGEENQGEPFLADSTCYFASFDDALTFEDGKGLERAQHSAHAINHIDALADALENLLDELAGESIHNYFKEETCKAHSAGIAALKAYRGEK